MTPAERRAERAERAQELLRGGLTIREIAEELGVSLGTAHRDVNPDSKRKANEASREYMRAKRAGKPTKGRQG